MKTITIPIISPLTRPIPLPKIIDFICDHQWTILFKIQNDNAPSITIANVEKKTINVLKPVVMDFLFKPTSTDTDNAPIVIRPKMVNNEIMTARIAITKLMQMKTSPNINMLNKNILNSSSSTLFACNNMGRNSNKYTVFWNMCI